MTNFNQHHNQYGNLKMKRIIICFVLLLILFHSVSCNDDSSNDNSNYMPTLSKYQIEKKIEDATERAVRKQIPTLYNTQKTWISIGTIDIKDSYKDKENNDVDIEVLGKVHYYDQYGDFKDTKNFEVKFSVSNYGNALMWFIESYCIISNY